MSYTIYRKLTIFILIIITLIIYSCSIQTQPITQTTIPLSESDRSEFNKVAITVQLDEELNVNISNLKDRYWMDLLEGSGSCNSIGCIFLPFVVVGVAVVEESVRSGMDYAKESEFRENLSNLNLNKLLSESIEQSFASSKAGFRAEISDTSDPNLLAKRGYDSILDLTIKSFEFNLCPRQIVYGYIGQEEARKGIGPLSSEEGDIDKIISKWNAIYPEYFHKIQQEAATEFLHVPDTIKKSKEEKERLDRLDKEIAELKPSIVEYASSDQIRTWMIFNGKITSIGKNKVLWERQEVYYDPKCEKIKDLEKNPEIIVDMITRSISNLAGNAVVQILY